LKASNQQFKGDIPPFKENNPPAIESSRFRPTYFTYFEEMKLLIIKVTLLVVCSLLPVMVWSQTMPDKLAAAFRNLSADPQLRNGMASLYVVDAKTGAVIFDKNGLIGMAPASTMKVITSVSAYELLGKNFQYQTRFAYHKSTDGVSILVLPNGDPTLGSWRWPGTKEEVVIKGVSQAIRKLGIKSISEIILDNTGWNEEAIPGGWIWQDIGNYYGAGPGKLNWRENQYDVILKSGKNIGAPVSIVKTMPPLTDYALKSELTAAAAGTGDNAYIYFPLHATDGVIRGTIPVNENNFKISGAMPAPGRQFVKTLSDTLTARGLSAPEKFTDSKKITADKYTVFYTITSPPLDSIIYWFNKKSINLYGEALVKTIAYKSKGVGATDTGVELIRNYWKEKGIPVSELNIVDGSGLSPLNRVTTHAQVSILQHAQKQTWYNGFYAALPLYNGMKMKSGTIKGVKGFCGYHRGKDGEEYIFSFLVNNYNGSAAALVQKMYKVLDVMK